MSVIMCHYRQLRASCHEQDSKLAQVIKDSFLARVKIATQVGGCGICMGLKKCMYMCPSHTCQGFSQSNKGVGRPSISGTCPLILLPRPFFIALPPFCFKMLQNCCKTF